MAEDTAGEHRNSAAGEDSISRRPMTHSGKRAMVVVLIVTALVASGAAALWLSAKGSGQISDSAPEERSDAGDIVTLSEEIQRNIGLSLEAAQVRTLVRTVQATGIVGPNETRVAHIRPLARGRIEKVHVRLGDRVRAGQPLADYDNIELGELIGQYLSAAAALEKANAEAEVTRQSLERAQRLIDLGAVAKAEYEKRNAEYKNALASINSEKAELENVEEKIHRFGLTDADLERLKARTHADHHREASHSTLRAPFGGIVIKSEIAEGEAVDTEREMFTVADISTVWVQADVYEKDIALIRQGQEVQVRLDSYPGEVFRGKITYVSDFLDPKTRTAKVRCEVPNPGSRLKLEMFARIDIPTSTGRDAVMIPSSAIQHIEDKPVVFIKTGDGQFQKREVQLGAESDGWVEVTSGLNAGEVVVALGSFQLKSALLKDQISGED
ncbi:MAG TPA: efflux RND transporter periplasmic adaptor subunit [Blastocatellia bacterium]|nr:efflux RND transporter periplasmic adaptor subunit [Blastocatellia bacterium]